MNTRRPVFAVMLFVALANSASAQAVDQDKSAPAPAQTAVPLFDCFAMNSAWGFTLSGKFIDADGGIFAYGRRGKGWLAAPVIEQGAKYYAEADLQDKFGDARRTGNVDAAALADNSALIEAAAAGKLDISDGSARDAGSSGCHAYVHDAPRRRYRDIDLGSDGGVNDMRTTNDAPAAQQLLKWLRSVGVAQ